MTTGYINLSMPSASTMASGSVTLNPSNDYYGKPPKWTVLPDGHISMVLGHGGSRAATDEEVRYVTLMEKLEAVGAAVLNTR